MHIGYLSNRRMEEIQMLAEEFRLRVPSICKGVHELLGHIREQAEDIEHYKEQLAKMSDLLNRCECVEESEDDCE